MRKFPSPLEVDRYLYYAKFALATTVVLFPSPREVDRELYMSTVQHSPLTAVLFPATLEVDREL